MRKLILTLFVLIPFVAGCHQRPSGVIDQLAPGSQLTVTTKAGYSVTGKLAETRPDAIVIQPAGGAPATVRRSDIATVTISAPETAPASQPAAAAPGGAATVTPEGAPAPNAGSTATAPGPGSSAKALTGSPAKGAPAGVPPGAPEKPAAPAWREVTIPEGTLLAVSLDEGVGSDTSRVEEAVSSTLVEGVDVDGVTVLPAGSRVAGTVTHAKRSGKVKGVAELAVRFDSLTPKGSDTRYDIRTGQVARHAATTRKKDALKIGAPAAGGAIIGGLLGGKKGALIGGSVGGGAGTAVVLNTRGKEVHLPRGTHLSLRLLAPVTVRVPQ